jgi:hypothetical protein
MKAFTAIAAFDIGRTRILTLCPSFAEVLSSILLLDKTAPIAVESCIETISRCCAHTDLQQALIDAGVVWRLIPFLLAYDGTLQEDFSDESLRGIYCQNSSNMHAVLAAKALGRLAGVMFHDLASPPNQPLITALSQLLTLPISKLLRNRRPWDLLVALNQNVERTTMIWNLSMRRELLSFVLQVHHTHTTHTSHTHTKHTTHTTHRITHHTHTQHTPHTHTTHTHHTHITHSTHPHTHTLHTHHSTHTPRHPSDLTIISAISPLTSIPPGGSGEARGVEGRRPTASQSIQIQCPGGGAVCVWGVSAYL